MTSRGLTLAIDQGTHATRAVVLDARGAMLASGARDVALFRPAPEQAEQDGEEMVASVQGAISEALSALGVRVQDLCAAGIASQRASCVCWDGRSGKPLSPIFSWQDRRAHRWLGQFAGEGESVHRKTGLFLSAHYGASKLRWALDNLPAVRAAQDGGYLRWGPQASFLAFRLAQERPFVADPQCAARTQLWNIHTKDWDPDLLALFGLPAGFLPTSVPTCHAFGTMRIAGKALPLVALNGDQSAAVFAFGQPDLDSAYVNIGTSAFVQRVLPRYPGYVPKLLTGIILDDGSTTLYTLEGNVNGAGAALEWLRSSLGIADAIERLPAWLDEVGDPPLFLNGIAGLGGPFWMADFPSRFVGEGGAAEKAVAVVESIAFLLQANLDEMAGRVSAPKRIRASGGVSRFDGLCKTLAAISGLPVHRRDDPEATARGIGFLASGRPDCWNVDAGEEVFLPGEGKAVRARYARWREAMREETGI